ncbi:MAG: CPXCG motif-containing cysteine-rich protein [Gammaproteobacteria bacterium]|nr:CPXCG motif-containing cysteine-rich protein [Gammaproteobacteria bacterium]
MLKSVECPYCGECFENAIEPEDGSQDYIEDCPVCCRPIEFHTESNPDEDTVSVTVRRDDD